MPTTEDFVKKIKGLYKKVSEDYDFQREHEIETIDWEEDKGGARMMIDRMGVNEEDGGIADEWPDVFVRGGQPKYNLLQEVRNYGKKFASEESAKKRVNELDKIPGLDDAKKDFYCVFDAEPVDDKRWIVKASCRKEWDIVIPETPEKLGEMVTSKSKSLFDEVMKILN